MATKLAGELSRSFDPAVSEWGNPSRFAGYSMAKLSSLLEILTVVEGTRGTETSKYPKEYKSKEISSVAVSESEIA